MAARLLLIAAALFLLAWPCVQFAPSPPLYPGPHCYQKISRSDRSLAWRPSVPSALKMNVPGGGDSERRRLKREAEIRRKIQILKTAGKIAKGDNSTAAVKSEKLLEVIMRWMERGASYITSIVCTLCTARLFAPQPTAVQYYSNSSLRSLASSLVRPLTPAAAHTHPQKIEDSSAKLDYAEKLAEKFKEREKDKEEVSTEVEV